MVKFFTGISLKYWLALLFLLIGLGLLAKYNHTVAVAIGLKAEVKEQKVTIAVQKETIKTVRKVATLDEKLQVETQKAVQATTTKHERIQAKADKAVRAAEVRYEQTPVTLQSVEQFQVEISSINIDSLWEAFCSTQKAHPNCPTP